ncbi:hypothetical protein STEG23_002171, partial [Scotinomys teguina]
GLEPVMAELAPGIRWKRWQQEEEVESSQQEEEVESSQQEEEVESSQQEEEVESSRLEPQAQSRGTKLEVWSPLPVPYFLWHSSTTQTSPNSAINWGPSVQMP